MIDGSIRAAPAISSHIYPGREYLSRYCVTGVFALEMTAFISEVKRVLTEISIGVMVTFFQGARNTMRVASGSNHQLNSRRASMAPGSIAPLSAYNPPPIMTNSLASVATWGSSFNAKAKLVNGPPAQSTTSPGYL